MHIRKVLNKLVQGSGYELSRIPMRNRVKLPSHLSILPDGHLYHPHFQPWRDWEKIPLPYVEAMRHSLLSPESAWVLLSLARQALHLKGEFWECGVFQGGSAAMFAKLLEAESAGAPPPLRLFDTFAGMPPTDPEKDLHKENDFNDTSLEAVKKLIGPRPSVHFHPGFMPDTFAGLESSRIAFAHIDVDIYKSIHACCEFIYPRLLVGGFMIFDDYGFSSCPGARQAVDEFFAKTKIVPLVLGTSQAIVFKGVES